MSQKLKTFNSEGVTCEKYLNKILRQENFLSTKKSPAPKAYQEKLSHVVKNVPQSTVPKPKSTFRQIIPMQKATTLLTSALRDQGDNVKEVSKTRKPVERARSRSRLENKEREPWGQLLQNKSKDNVSSFSNFDPLRTLHFLSKELRTKLESVVPDNQEVFQMISDIHHALKRIPPEVSTLLRNLHNEYPPSEVSEYTTKSTLNRSCQTPPTLYQEDTEKFQKIMEENTYKLEASCKQLEMVCNNLQKEKEMTEKDLEEARENIEMLYVRVKELENEIDDLINIKIKKLEEEKQQLREELDTALTEVDNNPTAKQLRKLVDELKKQKLEKDEACAKLECDMTLLKMEKEKFETMLAVRDREVKNIQDEISKIQEQVTKELAKLNIDVTKKSSSLKIISVFEPSKMPEENLFLEIGDTTISSITTTESDKEQGDTKAVEKSHNDVKECETYKDLPSSKDRDIAFEEILKGLTPSMQTLLASHNT